MKYHISLDVELKKNPYKGIYIALEGIDGSGKTTQVDLLYDYFKKQGREVVKTREPRKQNSLIANFIQQILLGKTDVPPAAFQYLFTADRVMHHEELVIPSLKAGKIVISDRCMWSAVPYGILDKNISANENTKKFVLVAQSIMSMYHQFTLPDYTFYLDIPLATSLKRIESEKRGEVKEVYETAAKLKKIVHGYKWLLKKFPKEFIVVNAKQPVDSLTTEIIKKIKI